jgi:PPP family 3-phenylpropionic acid transporter
VIDAATLRMTRRRGTDFGGIRAWGTVGFMVVTALSGPIIGWFGDGAFVPLFVALALAKAATSLQLPEFRAAGEPRPAPVAKAAKVARPSGRLGQLLKPWFISALLGLGIVYSTHGAMSAFAALLWRDQGVPEALIGPLIAVMAASEATMMFAWTRLKVKVSARQLILLACVVAAVRWSIMVFSPPIWLLFGLQLLHSVTFAVSYFGGVYFIANWTSEEVAAEAQGFSFVLQQAMSVIAVLGMGWAVAGVGDYAWLVLGLYSLCGAGFVLISLRLVGPTPEPGAEPPASASPVPQDEILP